MKMVIPIITPHEQLTLLVSENYHFLLDETSTESSTTSTVNTTATQPDNILLNGTVLALSGGIGVIVVVMVIVKMKKSS
ncbi:MAG: hypothetical protein KAQ65_05580 [Candidatus Thorarchaeota archaeon]|nr:hypothetical protein [Candidatus Thorarchaeota archaeon]